MIITAWRIVRMRHVETAFAGEGAKLYPGRWNHRGTPMVYTAGALSLAVLEMLVHLGEEGLLSGYVAIPVEFDDSNCGKFDIADLPLDWNETPVPQSTRDIGTRWAQSLESVVLAVPSAIIPLETMTEMNYLINPLHPDFSQVEIGEAKAFRIDHRLA